MKIGEISFILGLVIAILAGIFVSFTNSGWIVLALVVLGLIVGFLNITEKETQPFLIASIALIVTAISGSMLTIIPFIGNALNAIVQNIAVFVAPAVIVVSIKAVYALAKD